MPAAEPEKVLVGSVVVDDDDEVLEVVVELLASAVTGSCGE